MRLSLLRIRLRRLVKQWGAHRPKPWKMQDQPEWNGELKIIRQHLAELEKVLCDTQ